MSHVGRMARIVCCVVFGSAACAVLLVADVAPAGACSCLAIDDDEAFAVADAVFTGTAVARREPSDPVAPATLVLDVDRVYKGSVSTRQEVRTPSSSAACGLSPTRAPLLVFAAEPGTGPSASLDAGPGQLVAFLCGGTRALAAEDVPASFGAGIPPAVASHDGAVDGRMLAVGALATVVVAVAAAVAVTRRTA